MPNPGADRPLRKVTLNLFEEDVVWMEKNEPQWSGCVRELVQNHVRYKKSVAVIGKPTLGERYRE